MKRFWNIISFLAVVNLLALAMFVAWLWQSGRLNGDRIRHIRNTLAMTIAQEQAAEAEQADEAERQRQEAAERARRQNPPLPSAEQVRQISLVDDQTDQALRRLRDETAQLLAQLEVRGAELDQREQALESARQTWLSSIEAELARRTDEQFLKTVRQYESAPPKIGKQWMMELIAAGEQEQVVAYLNAMTARAASKILREFKTEEEAGLATELLDKLRTFGLQVEAAEESGDDDSLADAQ
jgi:hypothetical protein